MAKTIQQAAEQVILSGWKPIPLKLGSKVPANAGWQTARYERAEDYWNNGNLGVLTGEPSGWLVDVDLDCEEARHWAPDFLPSTDLITGRAGAESSHWWYVCRDAKTTKLCHSDGWMVVEIRSTGCQTMIGPSIHPSGEQLDPMIGTPAEVSWDQLLSCVRGLHSAVLTSEDGETRDEDSDDGSDDSDDEGGAGGGVSGRGAPRSSYARPAGWDEGRATTRAATYVEHMPAAISGEGGHAATYAAAVAAVHGFCLPPSVARRVLAHYNQRCRPTWNAKALDHKITDAVSREHNQTYGWLWNQGEGNGTKMSAAEMAAASRRFKESQAARCAAPDELPTFRFGSITFAPRYLRDFVDTGPEDCIIEGLVARGRSTMVSGSPKAGKSTWVAQMLQLCETGGECCGLRVAPCKPVIVSEETDRDWAKRKDRMPGSVAIATELCAAGRPSDKSFAAYCEFMAEQVRKVVWDLIVFDTLAYVMPADEENSSSAMGEVIKQLNRIRDAGAAVLILHHTNKAMPTGIVDPVNSHRGSTAIPGGVDQPTVFSRAHPDHMDKHRLICSAGRISTPDPLVLDFVDGQYVRHGNKGRDAARHCDETIQSLLLDRGRMTWREVIDAWPEGTLHCPTSSKAAAAIMEKGVKSGYWKVVKEKNGVANIYHPNDN